MAVDLHGGDLGDVYGGTKYFVALNIPQRVAGTPSGYRTVRVAGRPVSVNQARTDDNLREVLCLGSIQREDQGEGRQGNIAQHSAVLCCNVAGEDGPLVGGRPGEGVNVFGYRDGSVSLVIGEPLDGKLYFSLCHGLPFLWRK